MEESIEQRENDVAENPRLETSPDKIKHIASNLDQVGEKLTELQNAVNHSHLREENKQCWVGVLTAAIRATKTEAQRLERLAGLEPGEDISLEDPIEQNLNIEKNDLIITRIANAMDTLADINQAIQQALDYLMNADAPYRVIAGLKNAERVYEFATEDLTLAMIDLPPAIDEYADELKDMFSGREKEPVRLLSPKKIYEKIYRPADEMR